MTSHTDPTSRRASPLPQAQQPTGEPPAQHGQSHRFAPQDIASALPARHGKRKERDDDSPPAAHPVQRARPQFGTVCKRLDGMGMKTTLDERPEAANLRSRIKWVHQAFDGRHATDTIAGILREHFVDARAHVESTATGPGPAPVASKPRCVVLLEPATHGRAFPTDPFRKTNERHIDARAIPDDAHVVITEGEQVAFVRNTTERPLGELVQEIGIEPTQMALIDREAELKTVHEMICLEHPGKEAAARRDLDRVRRFMDHGIRQGGVKRSQLDGAWKKRPEKQTVRIPGLQNFLNAHAPPGSNRTALGRVYAQSFHAMQNFEVSVVALVEEAVAFTNEQLSGRGVPEHVRERLVAATRLFSIWLATHPEADPERPTFAECTSQLVQSHVDNPGSAIQSDQLKKFLGSIRARNERWRCLDDIRFLVRLLGSQAPIARPPDVNWPWQA